MREYISRRKALSLLGTALGLALALTEDKAVAETAGMERPQQWRAARRQPRGQLATAPAESPAEAASARFYPTPSYLQFYGFRGPPPQFQNDEGQPLYNMR